VGGRRSSQAQASPLNHTLSHHPQVDSATANAADVNLDASLRARRSSSVATTPSSAGPSSGGKSTTADWISQVTSKLPELCPQWQAFALQFLKVGRTKEFAAWSRLCNQVGAALLAPKTLALDGDASTPVEMEGHGDGDGNPDEPAAIAQGADETEDKPNGDDEGEGEEANGDIDAGNATQSHDPDNFNGHDPDTISLLHSKPVPATRSGPTVEELIAFARRRQHASAIACVSRRVPKFSSSAKGASTRKMPPSKDPAFPRDSIGMLITSLSSRWAPRLG
jgi:hypothetical protein